MSKFIRWLGLAPTPEEQKVLDAINETGYKSMRVIGRGTVTMDPSEIIASDKYKKAAGQAEEIVSRNVESA